MALDEVCCSLRRPGCDGCMCAALDMGCSCTGSPCRGRPRCRPPECRRPAASPALRCWQDLGPVSWMQVSRSRAPCSTEGWQQQCQRPAEEREAREGINGRKGKEGQMRPHLEAQLIKGGALQLGQLEGRQGSSAGSGVQMECHTRLTASRAPAPLLLAGRRYPRRLQCSRCSSTTLLSLARWQYACSVAAVILSHNQVAASGCAIAKRPSLCHLATGVTGIIAAPAAWRRRCRGRSSSP